MTESAASKMGRDRVKLGPVSGKKKRVRYSLKNVGESSGSTTGKKVKPNDDDAYAQFHPLQDYLQQGLDVVFCGINPGRMSAETGHPFANPTNHFWRCLYRSGMTTTLVPPSEAFCLLERFNIGLTNLVDRPSAQACELSRAEMAACVPPLLDKLARHRPRFVCFIGLVMWETVRNSLVKSLPNGMEEDIHKGEGRKKSHMGLQTYKLVYGDVKAGLPRETLLFVVPCTSGRVVHYQLSDKIGLFTGLHMLVKTPSSDIETSEMQSVVWPPSSS